MKTISVLGYPLLRVPIHTFIPYLQNILASQRFVEIMTLNPEIIVQNERLPELKQYVQQEAICVPDGIGLTLAARFLERTLLPRITGVDLANTVVQSQVFSIYLIGTEPPILEKAIQNLRCLYPKLVIKGFHHGFFSSKEEMALIRSIAHLNPDIVLAGLGYPKQTLFLRKLGASLNRGIGIGIGGMIDIWGEKFTLAPSFIRKSGMEWLYRAIQNPVRLKRLAFIFSYLSLLLSSQLDGIRGKTQHVTDARKNSV